MTMKQKLLSLLLAVAMLLSLSPAVYAAETVHTYQGEWLENPMYEGLSFPVATQSGFHYKAVEEPDYVSPAKAAVQLREAMVLRASVATIYIVTPFVVDDSDEAGEVLSDIFWEALEHTGVPGEGDNLLYQFARMVPSGGWYNSGGKSYMEIDFTMEYYTTAAQEQEMDKAVDEVMAELNLEDMTQYQAICAIYDYICMNVVYDYENVGDSSYRLQFTGYAALVQGIAVCQGYANLFYRLALEADIDCRIIGGSSFGEGHAWNIVELDGVYYNVDSTWDAGETDYDYFMLNMEDFEDHDRDPEYLTDEFFTDYPMAEESYSGQRYEPGVVYTSGNFRFTVEDGAVSIVGYTGTAKNVTVPATINGMPVVRICSGAFYENNTMKTLTFSEGITAIDSEAIVFCSALTAINYPASMTLVDSNVNSGVSLLPLYCPNVATVTVSSDNPTAKVVNGVLFSKDGSYLLYYPPAKTGMKYTVPNGVTVIGNDAFADNPYLKNVVMPDSVTVLGYWAFSGCTNLASVTLSNHLESIGQFAFSQTALTAIHIPASVKVIVPGAFGSGCKLETITVEEGNSVYYAVDNVLYGVYDQGVMLLRYPAGAAADSFTVPDGVTYIAQLSFGSSANLVSVDLPDGLREIDTDAFSGCTKLCRLVIPASVERLGESIVIDTAVRSVYFEGKPTDIADNAFLTNHPSIAAYYPKGVGWTAADRRGYGGRLIWESWDPANPPVFTDVSRISGKNRAFTALAAADVLKTELGVEKFDAIIIASGTNFADALAGSYLAAVKSAPILLYTSGSVTQNVEYVMDNLSSAGVVYILGGTGAVPWDIEKALLYGNVQVKRLSGKDRFATNIAILQEAGVQPGQEILVCTGYNFADSLSASATGLPILLVNSKKDKLTDAQMEYLTELGVDEMTIIGGEGAVSELLKGKLEDYGTVDRLKGKDRYATSVAIAEAYFDEPDTVYIAYGKNFPDGLCGGPLAYACGAPLLLVQSGKEAAAADFVDANRIERGYVLGGTGAVSDESVTKIFG